MRIFATRRRKIVLLLLALVIVASGYFVWWVIEDDRNSNTLSCLGSIGSAVIRANPIEMRKIVGPTRGWQLLDDAQTDEAFRLANPSDCLGTAPGAPLRDRWGHRIRIHVKEDAPTGTYFIVISSDGPDGLPATDDDLTAPYRTNLKELN